MSDADTLLMALRNAKLFAAVIHGKEIKKARAAGDIYIQIRGQPLDSTSAAIKYLIASGAGAISTGYFSRRGSYEDGGMGRGLLPCTLPANLRAFLQAGEQAPSDADDSYDELAVAGTGKDVVLMATGVNFLTAPSRRIELPIGR